MSTGPTPVLHYALDPKVPYPECACGASYDQAHMDWLNLDKLLGVGYCLDNLASRARYIPLPVEEKTGAPTTA